MSCWVELSWSDWVSELIEKKNSENILFRLNNYRIYSFLISVICINAYI